MIISRTPFRISFFGGGTDYPAWYREKGGSVLATTIDKYCYISCRRLPPFFGYKHRIVYSQVETVNHFKEIKHPAVKAVLEYFNLEDGLEIHHDGDLPARSGMGSSSSFTVGMLNALKALQSETISKQEMAEKAIYIEQQLLKETVGSQDQISAAYGGFNRIDFKTDDTFDVTPMILPKERLQELEDSLVLYFTGFSRFASEVAKTTVDNFHNTANSMSTMQSMVDESISILQSRSTSIFEFGKLLNESWKLKRMLSNRVTNTTIDEIYEAGLAAGATGGKVLGAGGGGFVLFQVPKEFQPRLREKLKSYINVSFKFESMGSKIALYDPNF